MVWCLLQYSKKENTFFAHYKMCNKVFVGVFSLDRRCLYIVYCLFVTFFRCHFRSTSRSVSASGVQRMTGSHRPKVTIVPRFHLLCFTAAGNINYALPGRPTACITCPQWHQDTFVTAIPWNYRYIPRKRYCLIWEIMREQLCSE